MSWFVAIVLFLVSQTQAAPSQAPDCYLATPHGDIEVTISWTGQQWITVLPETARGQWLHCHGYLPVLMGDEITLRPAKSTVHMPAVTKDWRLYR
jgi:hypothetical protein